MKPSLLILPALLSAPAMVPLLAAVAYDKGGARLADHLSSQLIPEGSSVALESSVKSSYEFSDEWLPNGSNPAVSLRTASAADHRAQLIASAKGIGQPSLTPDQPTSTEAIDRKQSRGVVRFGDTLIKIAQRYGITLSDLLRLNPGLETARLVVGSQIRLAQSSPIRSRSLLALKPSSSGGLSWPELPNFGKESPEKKAFQPPISSQQWTWPTKGVFTSGYGWRWGRMHKGIDVANNVGTPIVASREGRVIFAGWSSGGYGYLVEILHPDGSRSLYAHNSSLEVRKGQSVRQGQMISRMGSTGRSTGPHLHFEIRPAGKGAINPLKLLPPRA